MRKYEFNLITTEQVSKYHPDKYADQISDKLVQYILGKNPEAKCAIETFVKDYAVIVGATEYAVLFYRDKLPKYRNNGKMQFNWFEFEKDFEIKKIHPTQKPLSLLKRLIELFTDEGDTVVDVLYYIFKEMFKGE